MSGHSTWEAVQDRHNARLKEAKVPEKSQEKYGVYVSGPMTDLPDCNYAAFHEAERFLTKVGGMEVFNPANNFDGAQDRELKEYYAEDFRLLCGADAIVFLPGWKQSAGARIEYMIARSLKLDMYTFMPNDQFVTPENQYGNAAILVMDPDEGPVELVAGALVRNGARQAVYGPPDQDFMRTARMMNGLHGSNSGTRPEHVALNMVLLKLSRLMGTPGHRDSIVDAVGYLVCYALIMEKYAE